MKRPGLFVGIGAICGVLGYAAYDLSSSDEAQIQTLVVAGTQAFNERDRAGCLAAFDSSYVDRSRPGLDRERLGGLLQVAFATQLRSRLRLVDGSFDATIDRDDVRKAAATFELRLDLQAGPRWLEQWRVEVAAELDKMPDGWRIVASEHRTVSGQRPR